MNLYLRLLWTLLRSWVLKKHDIYEPLTRTFRVLPNDIDINLHMNNGRYLTIVDLMLVEYFSRSGYAKILLQHRWSPMSGGAIVTYRRSLKPFQKYQVRFEWIGCDKHWNFMRFSFLTMNGRLCATGYTKGAAVSPKGLVENQSSFDLLGIALRQNPIPTEVEAWMASETALMASADATHSS